MEGVPDMITHYIVRGEGGGVQNPPKLDNVTAPYCNKKTILHIKT